jgi:hypothetical protein
MEGGEGSGGGFGILLLSCRRETPIMPDGVQCLLCNGQHSEPLTSRIESPN